MKKYRKTLLLLLLTCGFIFSAFSACAFFGTGEGENVVLLNWENETAETLLGSPYNATIGSVFDEDGNSYPVEIEVKTKDGKEVALYGNQFDVEYLDGYEITYKANVKGTIREKTVLLNVVDDLPPVISLGGTLFCGKLGENVELPFYTVKDNSHQEISITETLTDPEGEIVEPNGYMFTPAKSGKYLFTVSATDEAGLESAKTVEMYVRGEPAKDEIIKIDHASVELEVKSMNGTTTVSYTEEEIAGKSQLLKVVINEQWPNLMVAPRRAITDYKDYNRVSFNIYFDPATTNKEILYVGNEMVVTGLIAVKPGVWTEIVLDKEAFFKKSFLYDDFYQLLVGYNDSVRGGMESNLTCYISDIKAVKILSNVATGTEFVNFGDKSVLNQLSCNSDFTVTGYHTEEVTDNNGVSKTNTVSFRGTGSSWNEVYVTPSQDVANFGMNATFKITIYIDPTTVASDRTAKLLFIPAKNDERIWIPVGEWVTIEMPWTGTNNDPFRPFCFLNDDINAPRDANFVMYISSIVVE